MSIDSDTNALTQILKSKQVIICCGAGGVGKTTTAASLAIAGARMGKRVLVLTIDPSLRLAQALGVERNPRQPVAVSSQLLSEAGIREPGSLHAWMLDPKAVADDAIHSIVKDEATAAKYLENRIYKQFTQMVTGMHEYTAMKAVHCFMLDKKYDLVVLDTPPSRHALDFLEAPGRIAKFLDGRVLKLFLPSDPGIFRRAAAKIVNKGISAAFGDDLAGEILLFVTLFSGIFGSLSRDLGEVRKYLSNENCAFLLVTSPTPAALTEAFFFHDKTRELGLPFEGFILNRSNALGGEKAFPSAEAFSSSSGSFKSVAPETMEKLHRLARLEQHRIARDTQLLSELKARAGKSAIAVALPGVVSDDRETSILLALAAKMS